MSSERPINPRFDEDVHFNLVSSGPARYQAYTDKPVQYFTVVDKENGSVLGYLWADDEEAAAFEPRQAGGARAMNEGGFWLRRLRSAKERGLTSSQALAELYGNPETAGKGRPLPGSLTDAPNAAAVEALAEGQ
ncbi:hypothetical protein [Streptomyces sp. Ru73]|uniref:hypothetical protein n=1 Tax=Streptomyces sp. Ru73 TaxID=2080748 RepID=UPI0021565276|nr:hypothetical protein [Streptomyces sp. Ru73]